MEFIKMDDPRLDENYSYLFIFKKGDQVKSKDNPRLNGEIVDGVFVGEFPAFIAASNDSYKKGRTLYEIKLNENDFFIVAGNEIVKK